jgi:hypothetical protein
MQNELIFFIDQSEISIFKKDSDKYENVKIRGEELFQYEGLSDSLIFLEEYLKNVLGLQTYNETSLFIFSKNEIGINHKEIQNIFKTKNIKFLSFDVIKAYQDVLNAQYGEKAKEFEQKLHKQLQENEKILNAFNSSKKDYDSLKKLFDEKEKEIKKLTEKAKLWDNYLIEKSKIKREVIYLNDAKLGRFTLNLSNVKKITLLKENGENVKGNQKIANGFENRNNEMTSQFGIGVTNLFHNRDEIAVWESSKDGYIYWLASNNGSVIPIQEFQIKDENGNVALAVISDSPDDKIEDILDFMTNGKKKVINDIIKILNGYTNWME